MSSICEVSRELIIEASLTLCIFGLIVIFTTFFSGSSSVLRLGLGIVL